ncbi:MAG TPA: peptide ABC transporter substrate-binding protein, partial [Chloroflexota bacterium]
QAQRGPKILVAGNGEDPKNMWDGINGGGGSGAREIGHIVNQYLANILPDGSAVPRLLAELPSQDKGTWKVTPDGKMEVTYKVRPGVTWHDGVPFTAEDIAFSWEVDRDPAIPNGNQSAVRLISGVTVVDPMTAVATWSTTYAFADRLEHREFYPLPKHLLEKAYRDSKDTLIAQPFFNREFIGVGPFKLTTWEPGAFMEMAAYDNYFLGRPKLDRIRINFITDMNVGVANFRAGSLNTFFTPGSPDWDKLESLKGELVASGKGDVILERVRWEFVEPQKGPSAQPADLRDPRLRQALILALNRQALTESLQGQFGGVAHSWEHPTFPIYAQLKDAITEYPYDPTRAKALLADLGWTPGSDGILQKGGSPFQMRISAEEVRLKQSSVAQQDWKAIGIDAQITILSAELLRDAEARVKAVTGVAFQANPMGALSATRRFESVQTPAAANKFAGTNRGEFNNPEWDDVGARIRSALDDGTRVDLEKAMLRILGNELPVLPVQYELQAVAVIGFTGFIPVSGTPHTGNIMHTTNIHEWDLT